MVAPTGAPIPGPPTPAATGTTAFGYARRAASSVFAWGAGYFTSRRSILQRDREVRSNPCGSAFSAYVEKADPNWRSDVTNMHALRHAITSTDVPEPLARALTTLNINTTHLEIRASLITKINNSIPLVQFTVEEKLWFFKAVFEAFHGLAAGVTASTIASEPIAQVAYAFYKDLASKSKAAAADEGMENALVGTVALRLITPEVLHTLCTQSGALAADELRDAFIRAGGPIPAPVSAYITNAATEFRNHLVNPARTTEELDSITRFTERLRTTHSNQAVLDVMAQLRELLLTRDPSLDTTIQTELDRINPTTTPATRDAHAELTRRVEHLKRIRPTGTRATEAEAGRVLSDFETAIKRNLEGDALLLALPKDERDAIAALDRIKTRIKTLLTDSRLGNMVDISRHYSAKIEVGIQKIVHQDSLEGRWLEAAVTTPTTWGDWIKRFVLLSTIRWTAILYGAYKLFEHRRRLFNPNNLVTPAVLGITIAAISIFPFQSANFAKGAIRLTTPAFIHERLFPPPPKTTPVVVAPIDKTTAVPVETDEMKKKRTDIEKVKKLFTNWNILPLDDIGQQNKEFLQNNFSTWALIVRWFVDRPDATLQEKINFIEKARTSIEFSRFSKLMNLRVASLADQLGDDGGFLYDIDIGNLSGRSLPRFVIPDDKIKEIFPGPVDSLNAWVKKEGLVPKPPAPAEEGAVAPDAGTPAPAAEPDRRSKGKRKRARKPRANPLGDF